MTHIVVPAHRSLAWYLCCEQYLAEQGVEGWMFWTPPATVICGRHQDIDVEVDRAYCREHGIAIVRRKSGGGTVYADSGNLMMSLISTNPHSQQVYDGYMQQVASALRSLGYPAVTTSHNDILVDGYKVSGTACYSLPTATIVHGTLLCTVDMEALARAITPSAEKLAKHAVASVRQRVRNLGTMPDMASLLTSVSRRMTTTEIDQVDRLCREEYPSEDA